MTSLVHHAPRLGRPVAPKVRPEVVVATAGRKVHVALVTAAVLAFLIAAVLVLSVAGAAIDTGGRIPHPAPLPAPAGQSVAGS